MARRKKKTVLFICTGNTCRSPMAGGYFEKLLKDRGIKHIEVKTAGVMTVAGLLPTQETVQLLEEVGVDIRKHRSTPLSPEMIRKVDYIFGFTPFHVQSAIRLNEDARGKTFLLKEYVGSDPRRARIQDPMGCTMEIYRRVFNDIKRACDKLIDKEEVAGKEAAGKPKKKRTTKKKKKTTKKKEAAKKTSGKKTTTKKKKKAASRKSASKKKTSAKKKTTTKKKKAPAKKKATGKKTSRKKTAKKKSSRKKK